MAVPSGPDMSRQAEFPLRRVAVSVPPSRTTSKAAATSPAGPGTVTVTRAPEES